MEHDFEVRLIPKNELETILPLVYVLNDGRIGLNVLKKRLQEMIPLEYQCIGVFEQEKLIGICGIWILNKFYVGKHIEPDNVFILEEYRSKGVGKLMLDWGLDYAQKIGCDASELNVYIKNEKGQKFWENRGYKKVGYHM